MWGSILSGVGTLLGGATSALGASQQLSARDAMQAQAEFNFAQHKKSLLEGPSLEMAGLKRAGINPFYRYGQHGTPLHSAQGVSQAPSVNRLAELGGAIGSTVTGAVDAYGTIASAKKSEASAARDYQEIEQSVAEIARIRASTTLIDTQRDHELDKQAKTLAETTTEYARAALTDIQADLSAAQIRQAEATIAQIEANTGLIMSNTAIAKLTALVTEAKAIEDYTDAQRYAFVMNGWVGFLFSAAGDLAKNANPFGEIFK